MGFLLPIVPPANSIARFEMTSFTFMLVCVPEPVCQTLSGKWSWSLPAMTSSAARTIRSIFSLGSRPAPLFAIAQAFLSMAMAVMICRGIVSPKGKWWWLRSVCAPQ